MKQLLFLLLFPCLALAQYQGNANQKITLGEQTTADGLVWRGRLADTANLLTNKLDTSVYIVLDTGTRAMWYYRVSTTPKWTRLVDSLNNLQGQLSLTTKVTGTLPLGNGGTGSTTQNFVDLTTTQSIGGMKTFTSDVIGARFRPTETTASGTGMFAPTSTSLGFSTNGIRRMLLDADGYIGINSQTVDGNNLKILSNVNGFCLDLEKTAGFGALIQLKNTSSLSTGIFRVINSVNSILSEYTPTTNGINYSIGNVGIASATTSARLHLGAGTATAGTAPLKFTSGTNLTTAEAGAMEFNGTNLFFSPSTTRHTINHGLTGSATLDFPNTSANTYSDLTISITGAALSDVVSLGIPNASMSANNITYTAWVSAANTVTVRFANHTTGSIDPASETFKVFVTK